MAKILSLNYVSYSDYMVEELGHRLYQNQFEKKIHYLAAVRPTDNGFAFMSLFELRQDRQPKKEIEGCQLTILHSRRHLS